jgi:hypothetical protein
LRLTLLSIFTAASIAAPACSNAAPRSIDECEKIQAADAYNQCLAVFGPVARTHGVARETADTNNQDEGMAAADADTKVAAAPEEDSGRDASMRHHGARYGHAAHGFAHHGHWHHSTASAHAHGKRTTLAFSTVSSHGHLR